MDIKILEKNERSMKFVLECDVAFANAFRRIAMNEVPTMAIEFVDFVDNSSGLYDEIIANRLGLIPLIFPDDYKLRSECCNRGCSNCQVKLSLDKEGPCVVKAGDLKIDDEDVKPLDVEIPIVELLEGQKIKFTAIAILGFGKDHAKWQSAIIGYRNFPIVRIYPEKGDLLPALKVCPKGVYAKKNGDIGIAKSFNCDLCMRCVEVCEPGSIHIGADENSFIFSMESISGLSAEMIFLKTLDVLENRAKEFIKEVKKI